MAADHQGPTAQPDDERAQLEVDDRHGRRAFEQRVLARLREKRASRDASRSREGALTFGQRVADAVADTIGSWPFIITQTVVLALWITLNVVGFVQRWDPYPFILLNLMLSFQAAYAGPIIMMSQNRQEARDRAQAALDLETDLKAETLIEELHGSVEDLRLHRWAELLELQQRQIELLRELVTQAGGSGRLADARGERPKPSPS